MPLPSKEIVQPQTLDELQLIVSDSDRVAPTGGQSKRSIDSFDATIVDTRNLDNILEYQPDEYTITVQAGASLQKVTAVIEEQGQCLPFDPPVANEGATIGGMIATGLSGPGSQRFGAMRDFIIGVKHVDGQGKLIKGGGKVVKNAAGFDVPKLMVGSLGSLGILTEASFKVFPKPECFVTLVFQYERVDQAHEELLRLNASKYVLDALDIDDSGGLLVRIGGKEEALEARIQNLNAFLGREAELLREEDDKSFWERIRDFHSVGREGQLAKIVLSPSKLPALNELLASHHAPRHYSYGGSCSWIRWPDEIQTLDTLLADNKLGGLLVKSDQPSPLIGHLPEKEFIRRIKRALDPQNKFPTIV